MNILFDKLAEMPQEVIDKYRDVLPDIFIDFWEEYGIATSFDGYLRSINPDVFEEFVGKTFVLGENAIPLFVTAFGDLITMIELDGKYDNLYIIRYKDGYAEQLFAADEYFFRFLSDDSFKEDYFELDFYKEAVSKHGSVSYNECFGFVPLLALGGSKKVENLEKCGLTEHLMVIEKLVGGVEEIKDNI